ncbi:MAG: murein hydrolase activator EnvC family protein [Bacilli bacterium]|jgi:murein DD-endopeptidase MepM/ murein hydrolase activator NlpD|nr:peptidoglycan DD-metalloendopeptidase family protein [Bacilli bacterium]
MKRKLLLISLCLLLCFSLIPLNHVSAKTLNDIYKEQSKLKQDREDNINRKNKTSSEINKTKTDITRSSNEIEQAQLGVITAEKEIEALNIKIKEKDLEIKELINFYQVSEGESEYLEYAFGARDFTDFIYRLAIVEQLSKYNDEKLKEMNNMIIQNEQKKVALRQKEKDLKIKREALAYQLKDLGTQLKELSDASLDINAEIKAVSDLIKAYEAMGCKKDDDISVCARTPLDTRFRRPITAGRVTSNYGPRDLLGRTYHYGIDLVASGGEGSPIYAAANGRVAATLPRQSCGGNMLFIHHYINNKHYTTGYFHLLTMNVKVGDIVTNSQVIGTKGGYSTATRYFPKTGYDRCTTGAHLHFSIAAGHYLGPPPSGFSGWGYWEANNINPRHFINFPAESGGYWSGR